MASEITDNYDKSIAYIEISKVLLDQGRKDESQKVMEECLKLTNEITKETDKYSVYIEVSKVLMEQGKKDESLKAITDNS